MLDLGLLCNNIGTEKDTWFSVEFLKVGWNIQAFFYLGLGNVSSK
jgi:hypothetical protein